MFCNYQWLLIGVIIACSCLVIYGSSSTSIKEGFGCPIDPSFKRCWNECTGTDINCHSRSTTAAMRAQGAPDSHETCDPGYHSACGPGPTHNVNDQPPGCLLPCIKGPAPSSNLPQNPSGPCNPTAGEMSCCIECQGTALATVGAPYTGEEYANICKSRNSPTQCSAAGGIWAVPALTPDSCPEFWQANNGCPRGTTQKTSALCSRGSASTSDTIATCRNNSFWDSELWCCQEDGCGSTTSNACNSSTKFFNNTSCKLPTGMCMDSGGCDPLNDTCCGQCGTNDPPTCQPNAAPGCSSNTCCTPNPFCSSIDCPPKSYKPNPSKICKAGTCDNTIGGECCASNPECTKDVCNIDEAGRGPYQIFTPRRNGPPPCQGEKCSVSECCTNLGRCNTVGSGGFYCDPMKYDHSAKYDTGYCEGAICTTSDCCIPDPKCSGPDGNSPYPCPQYYHNALTGSNTTSCGVNSSCNADLCCTINPTCDGHACGKNKYDGGRGNLPCEGPVCTDNECCKADPICSEFSCSDDDFYHTYSHIKYASTTNCPGGTCTEDLCCVSTPTDALPLVQTYPLYPENYQ